MADLTTLANLEERLAITGTNPGDLPDAFLSNLISRASAIVETVIGRQVDSQEFTEYYNGDGTRFLNLRQGPVSVTNDLADLVLSSVVYDSDGAETLTTISVGDYAVQGRLDETRKLRPWKLPGYIEYTSAFTTGQLNYKVVYTAGWTTIPPDVEEAALHTCVWLKNRRYDAARSSRSIGDGTSSFDQSLTDLRADLRNILSAYIPVYN